MFNGNLVASKTDPIYFELKEDVQWVLSNPYPVTKIHGKVQNRSGKTGFIGGLDKANDSEWGAPSFNQPKQKKYHVQFLSDLEKA